MKISVCIATYNGEKYIKQQLNSVLPQLTENDEIIISDDLSSDTTLEIIKSIDDNRIKIYSGIKFDSLIQNFENALLKSTGDIIFLCDQDDFWEENKVSHMLKALGSNDLVISDCTIVDSQLNILLPSFFEVNGSRKGILKNIIKNSYIGCCMAFNRKVLNYALPFPKLIPMHDIWIGLVAEKVGNVTFLNEKLLKYRRHGDNVSLSSEKSNNSFLIKIKYRMQIIIPFIKFIFQLILSNFYRRI